MSERGELNNGDENSSVGKEKKLSKYAYGGIKGEYYMPFVPSNINMPEMTVYSIILGVIFAIIFASANTYLGLKVGLTISSGIPGAILSIAIFKNLFKRNNILESNLTSALSASGQSIAAGVIFILPAVILFGMDLSVLTIVTITALAALMGCYFITPIRRYLIVEEHGKLIYPEAMAQSEVLVIGTEGGKGLKYVLTLHYMDQLSKEAQSALKNSNASYMLISGVDKKAFEALEEEFNIHGYCLDDLLNLKQYHSLNLIKSKDGYESFITKLPPELKNN